MQASVELMLELGPAAIEARVLELAETLRSRLRHLGARVLADDAPELFRSPIVCARFEGRSVEAIAAELARQRIIISARLGNLRISPHFYNTEEDIDRLAVALGKLLSD
jgi:selenocysteine lyase/cysteine desulfurase